MYLNNSAFYGTIYSYTEKSFKESLLKNYKEDDLIFSVVQVKIVNNEVIESVDGITAYKAYIKNGVIFV